MGDSEEKKLSRLLQLKRAERHDGAFWEDFEVKFQERCLQATMKPNRMQFFSNVVRRLLKPSLAAISAGTLAILMYLNPLLSGDGDTGNDVIASEYLRVSMEQLPAAQEWVGSDLFEESAAVSYVSGIRNGCPAILTASQL